MLVGAKSTKTFLEIEIIALSSGGCTITFSDNPEKYWSMYIGAYRVGARELFFPNKYDLNDALASMYRWPFIAAFELVYDNVYLSAPYVLKYELNNHPHNWRKLSAAKKYPKNGICTNAKLEFHDKKSQSNVSKIKRRTLKILRRPPNYGTISN